MNRMEETRAFLPLAIDHHHRNIHALVQGSDPKSLSIILTGSEAQWDVTGPRAATIV